MTGSAEHVHAALGQLARDGLDLHGFLSVEDWDRFAGEAHAGKQRPGWLRTAIVIGGRGSRFCEQALACALDRRDPLDAATESGLAAATAQLQSVGIRAEAVLGHRAHGGPGGGYCDLVGLAAAAGLGWPSRLGLLLHPEAGPWIHLRGALWLDVALPVGRRLVAAAPCEACPAPCIPACPGAAVGAGFDAARCGETRIRTPGCAERCDARRACVVGGAFTYSSDTEAWHMEHAIAHLPAPAGGAANDSPGG